MQVGIITRFLDPEGRFIVKLKLLWTTMNFALVSLPFSSVSTRCYSLISAKSSELVVAENIRNPNGKGKWYGIGQDLLD